MSRATNDPAGAHEPPGPEAAIRRWRPRGLGSRGQAFCREAVAAAEPESAARAKALLYAAGKLARFGESVGLEPEAETLLREAVIERFIALGAPTVSPATRRTLRSNLRALARAIEAQPQPQPQPLPRERAKAPYGEAEIAGYLRLAAAQPSEARRMRAGALICLGAGAGIVASELRQLRGADVTQSAERRGHLERRIEQARERLQRLEAQREAAEALPRRQRRRELARIDMQEPLSHEAIGRLEAEMQELSTGDAARRELAEVDRVLAERRELAITAARIAPPAYIRAELGERPSDPVKRKAWDRGVAKVERYRQENGISDKGRAFGAEPRQRAERARREAELRRLREVQRQLGREPSKVQVRERQRGFGIAR